MNQSLSDSKIVESFISKSKKTSVLHFYKNKFVFQLESDHTPREIYFKEIDLILLNSQNYVKLQKCNTIATVIF